VIYKVCLGSDECKTNARDTETLYISKTLDISKVPNDNHWFVQCMKQIAYTMVDKEMPKSDCTQLCNKAPTKHTYLKI